MDGSWSTPGAFTAPKPKPKPKPNSRKQTKSTSTTTTTTTTKTNESPKAKEEQEKYYALVVDSGAIIKHSGFSTLHNSATKYITTQGVIDEIRDAKARHHLESLPFQLEVREPSAEGVQAVLSFSKKTGDYASLSSVDLNVLGLLYDLEKEGCRDVSHIRTEPKRVLGEGKVTLATNESHTQTINVSEVNIEESDSDDENTTQDTEEEIDNNLPQATIEANVTAPSPSNVAPSAADIVPSIPSQNNNVKKSWAQMVNSTAAAVQPSTPIITNTVSLDINEEPEETNDDDASAGGQFSDAEDDELIAVVSDDDHGANPEVEVNAEGPEDAQLAQSLGDNCNIDKKQREVLQQERDEFLRKEAEAEQKRKEESLKPISRDGKLFNSFRGYKHIVSSSGVDTSDYGKKVKSESSQVMIESRGEQDTTPKDTQSRVIGSAFASFGQDNDVDDDGEGWITSTKDIVAMKASGGLDPSKMLGDDREGSKNVDLSLPQKQERAACATTDFAMQNVILQMNLELLSVDGVKVRKLKSWVTRCGSCFRIYTGSENDGKKMFCSWCGSDALQRVAASVDGKTGRLKLHLRKNYKYNLRGTKYNLPKPGKGDRFKGDLLLREDQLMYGTWNQTYKKNKGSRASSSIFGNDVAELCSDLTKRDDIRIGFGRKNPNASKFGRERRGKKKKSATEKACGLRRY